MRDRTIKDLNPALVKVRGREYCQGLLDATNLANHCTSYDWSPYPVGDRVLLKLNFISKRQLRKRHAGR